MSFINNREKLFKSGPKCCYRKKRSSGKMKVASSSVDPRAWSLDPRKRRAYILDSMADIGSSSGGEDSTKGGTEIVNIEPKTQTASSLIRGSPSAGNVIEDTDHQVIKLNNKLFEAKDQIEELKNAKESLTNDKIKTEEEVRNLRTLVTNMKEQMVCLEGLRNSLCNPQSEIELEAQRNQLEEAQLEIRHLERKIKIYEGLRERHSKIRKIYNELLEEKIGLVKVIDDLRSEQRKLSDLLKSREQELVELRQQLNVYVEGSAEKIILRDRIAQKEEKLRELTQVVERQDVAMNDLKTELSSLSRSFVDKEDSLNQEILELRNTVGVQCDLITKLEDKLHSTELLVAELETLRDQFRTTNLKLNERIRSYEKDADDAVHNLEALEKCIEQLKNENIEKQKEIDKLALFPQNPDTMLYFSHLNKLVMSAGDGEAMSSENQTELLGSIKSIVTRLRMEMWGGNFTPLELVIKDVQLQTNVETKDCDVQVRPIFISSLVQTDLPDEYVQRIWNNAHRFKTLDTRLSSNEQRLDELVGGLDSLETELFNCIEDNYFKDIHLQNANKNSVELQETVHRMNRNLIENEKLLKEAMVEIRQQVESHDYLRTLTEITIDSSTNEYAHYISVLEASLWYKERLLEQCELETNEQHLCHGSEIAQMRQQIEQLKLLLDGQKSESMKLNEEVEILCAKLKEKKKLIQELEMESEERRNLMSTVFTHTEFKNDSLVEKRLQLSGMGKMCTKRFKKNYARRRSQIRKMMETCKKAKIIETRLNFELLKKDSQNVEYSKIVEEITSEKSKLTDERNAFAQQSVNLKNKVRDLEVRISSYEEKFIFHEELKMKMEKMVLKLMKRVARYKTALSAQRNNDEVARNYERTVLSEKLSYEIDLLKNENANLSETICGLKQKLSSLLELPESNSVELQVSLEAPERERLVQASSQSYCEKIVATLKSEYETAADRSHKNYANNLKSLKESYERDVAALKKSHAENLDKMQLLQQEELMFLSRKQNLAALEAQKSQMEENFELERSELRKGFLKMMVEKEELFDTEKRKLQKELTALEFELHQLRQMSSKDIENLTVNCESRIQAIEDLFRKKEKDLESNLETRIHQEVQNKIIELQSRREEKGTQYLQAVNDCGTDPHFNVIQCDSACNTTSSLCVSQRITDINYRERISCEVKTEEPNIVLLNVVQSLATTDDTPTILSEGEQYLSQIEELEKRLQTQQTESARKIRLYEKKIKHEQMKAKEIANILEQELKYSTDVHCKLGLQFNRAEQLELEKEALTTELLLCRQRVLNPNICENRRLIANEERLDTIIDSDSSLELEQSLNRLKEKIDEAADQGRRLSDQMWKKSDKLFLAEDLAALNSRLNSHSEVVNGAEGNDHELKVIMLQQRRIHEWTSHIHSDLPLSRWQ